MPPLALSGLSGASLWGPLCLSVASLWLSGASDWGPLPGGLSVPLWRLSARWTGPSGAAARCRLRAPWRAPPAARAKHRAGRGASAAAHQHTNQSGRGERRAAPATAQLPEGPQTPPIRPLALSESPLYHSRAQTRGRAPKSPQWSPPLAERGHAAAMCRAPDRDARRRGASEAGAFIAIRSLCFSPTRLPHGALMCSIAGFADRPVCAPHAVLGLSVCAPHAVVGCSSTAPPSVRKPLIHRFVRPSHTHWSRPG